VSRFLTSIAPKSLIICNGLHFATEVTEPIHNRPRPGPLPSGTEFRGLNMTDQKLHSLTENQLRALYNSAPELLKSLLDRKRALEEGTVWEMSIPQRAASKQY
jgi:hypothetical protein